jgi:hypothetical protein
MFYRVAIRTDFTEPWQWRSTPLSSLDALFAFLRPYRAIPVERLQVFSSTTREDLNAQLAQANSELEAHSARRVTATLSMHSAAGTPGSRDASPERAAASQGSGMGDSMIHGASINALEKKRFELEQGEGGDHDAPYLFTMPVSTPQMLAWMRLRARVQDGELQA